MKKLSAVLLALSTLALSACGEASDTRSDKHFLENFTLRSKYFIQNNKHAAISIVQNNRSGNCYIIHTGGHGERSLVPTHCEDFDILSPKEYRESVQESELKEYLRLKEKFSNQ